MRRHMILLLAGVAGFSVAVVAGIAGAKTFTLQMAKNAKVTNQAGTTKHEAIAVTGLGRAVYELTGDRPGHPECKASNQCFMFWPPVKVKSARGLTKAPGIKGKLGLRRDDDHHGHDHRHHDGHDDHHLRVPAVLLATRPGTRRGRGRGPGRGHAALLLRGTRGPSSPPSYTS